MKFEISNEEYKELKKQIIPYFSKKFPTLKDDIEGIMDEALTKAIINYNSMTKFKTYTFEIMKSLCIDELKKTQRSKRINNIVSLDSMEINESNNYYLKDKINIEEEILNKIIVKNLIDNLSEKEKLVITYYFYEDKTIKEIAEIFEVSDKAIYKILTKAKNKIRENIE